MTWISLKTQLPPKNITVMLCVQNDETKYIAYGDFKKVSRNKIIFDNPDWFNEQTKFTHWQYQVKHIDDITYKSL
jgi:hypothetical protein